MTAIVAAVGWLSGLFAAPALPPLDLAAAASLLVAVVGLGWLWRARPAACLAAVALVGALLAILRAQAADTPAGPGSVLDYADLGVDFELRGRIVAEPERVDRGTRLRVAALELRSGAIAGTTFGDVHAIAPGDDWRYGDLVALTGRLERPLDRDDVPLAEIFARRGLLASLRADDARLLGRDPPLARLLRRDGSPAERDAPAPEATTAALLDALRSALYDAKAAASDALDRRLPAPTAALARGLLLGGTSGMPPGLAEAFRRAGLTHVVAVSGYNITLVAAALAPLARLAASRLGAFALPALAVLGFTLAVGAPASAVRAAIMGCLVLLARAAGRPPDALAGLAVAALLMTLADPELIHDLGFVLSSLATLAIVAVYPWLDANLPGPRAAAPGLVVRAVGGPGGSDRLAGAEIAAPSGQPDDGDADSTGPVVAVAGGVAGGDRLAVGAAPAVGPVAARSRAAGALLPPGRAARRAPPSLGGWLLAAARETLVATLAVELLAVPAIGATFGRVSVVSPLANLLVLPVVPLAMATSLPIALGGAMPDWLVAPLAWAAWVPLAWIVAAVEACADPTWASLPLGRLPTALVWSYYAAAAVLLLTAHARSYRLALPPPAALARAAFDRLPAGGAIAAALLAALVAWAGAFSVPEGAPRLTFF
ncbi:MAG TPA: ComEC/Rec2 family competence protein, partial [Chloroflexota bacterium]